MTTSAARSATVAISQDSKRAIHGALLCEVEARFAMPGTDIPASFTSFTILSDLVLIAAVVIGALLPTLGGWRSESISSRQNVGLRRLSNAARPVGSP